jgi:hypothetical protein
MFPFVQTRPSIQDNCAALSRSFDLSLGCSGDPTFSNYMMFRSYLYSSLPADDTEGKAEHQYFSRCRRLALLSTAQFYPTYIVLLHFLTAVSFVLCFFLWVNGNRKSARLLPSELRMRIFLL